MKKILLLFTFILFQQTIIAQRNGVFLLKGNVDFKLSFNTCIYDKVYDDDGEKKSIAKTQSSISSLEIRGGLTNKINAIIDLPFIINKVNGTPTKPSSKSISTNYSSTGDLDLGIEYLFINNDPLKIIIGLHQSIGTGNNNQQIGLNTGYKDYHEQLKIKLAFEPSTKWNFISYVGFINHNLGYGDEISGKVELNIIALKNLWFNVRVEGIQPLENGDKINKPFANGKQISDGLFYGLYGQNRGYLKFSPELHYEFTKNWGTFISIKKIFIGQEYQSGITYEFGLHYQLESN